MSLPRSFALTAVIAAISMAPLEAEARGFSLPGEDVLSTASVSVETPLSHPRWSCSPTDADVCECIATPGRRESSYLLGVDDEATPISAKYLVSITDTSALMAADMSASRDETTTTIAFEAGTWWTTGEAITRLVFGEGTLTVEGGQLVDAEFSDVGWVDEVPLLDSPNSCDEITSLPLSQLISGYDVDDLRARAKSATFVDGSWSVDKLDFTTSGSPPLPSSLAAGEPISGFLAPALAFDGDSFRLTATYHAAAPDLSIRAHADSTGVGGVGVGRWSSSPSCPGGDCRQRSLFVDLYAGGDGMETAYLAGDFGAGEPGHHVSTSIDGLAARSESYDPSSLERLSRGAFMRDWSTHRLGAAFDATNHDLSLGAAIATEGYASFDITESQPHTTRLWADYGTRFATGERSGADVRIQHIEFDVADDDAGRLTRLSLGLERPMGNPGRAYLRPALRGDMITEVAGTTQGSEAGSRGQLDAVVDGGLAFRGTISSVDHLILPRAFVGRRLLAEDALPAGVYSARMGREALHQRGPFNVAGVGVEQQFSSASGQRLRIPLTLAVTDDGSASSFRADTLASAEYSSAHEDRPLVIALDGRCIGACEEGGLQSRLHLFWSDTIETLHLTGRGSAIHPSTPTWEQRIRSGASLWYLPDPVAFSDGDAEDSAVFHSTSIRGQWTQWSTEVAFLGDLGDISRSGMEVVVERVWPELGWATALHLGALGEDSRWAAILGLRNSPAF